MKGPLSQIRVSLVASLGAGQIIFLAGIGATENKVRRYINEPTSLFMHVVSFILVFQIRYS